MKGVGSVTPDSPLAAAASTGTAEEVLAAVAPLLGADELARVRALVQRGQEQEERLQLLQHAASALARSLDQEEIVEELSRGVQRALRCDAVMVASVDLDRSEVEVVRTATGELEIPPRVYTLGEGPLAEAARTGVPVLAAPYVASAEGDGDANEILDELPGTRAVLAAPMMHGRRLLGVVAALDTCETAFAPEAREVLATLATHAAAALSNARLFADSERERRQSDAMAEIARAVGESLRKGDVMRLILRHAVALLQAEGACIALRDDGYLHVVSALGIADVLLGVHFPVTGSLSGKVVTTGAALVTNDLAAEPDAHRPSIRLIQASRTVIVPLITARGSIGVLSVYDRSHQFSGEDARVLQRLADQVAVAIVNARLFEEVQEATREWSASFESIGMGMCIVDDEGRISRFNTRAMQLAEQEAPRTLVGRAFHEVYFGGPPEVDEDHLGRAIRDGVNARGVSHGVNGRALEIIAAPHPSGGAIVTFDDVAAQRAGWAQHRLVFEQSPEPLATLDTDGTITMANAAARVLFRRDDLEGVRWLDLMLHDLVEEARAHLQSASEGATLQHEYVMVRGDGDRRVVNATIAPLGDVPPAGTRAALVVSMHDVSGERRAREAVSHSEARYRQLFECTTDAVFTLDFRGIFTSANPAACEAFAATVDQLLGRSLYPFLGHGDVDRVTTFLRDSLNGEGRAFECAILRRGGGRRCLTVSTSPLRQGHSVIGILAVARDVTEPRLVSRTLEQSEVRWRELVASADDVIFTLDEEGNFTSVNASFERCTGLVARDVHGQNFTVALDPRDRDAMWETFVAALHGRRQRKALRFVDGHGAQWWGTLVASPLREEGQVNGVLAIVRDATREHRLVEAILAPDGAAPAEPWRDVHLAELARAVLAERADACARAGIVSSLDVESGAIVTRGDARQLQRALAIVVDGAITALAARPRGARLALRAGRRGDRVVVAIEDNAPALTDEARELAFAPFSGVRTAPGGDPLGLVAAHAIVRRHGGRLDVEATEIGGNLFTIELAAHVTDARATPAEEGRWPTS